MKQIEVQIMGQGYLLTCPEGGEAMLHDAVDRVDTAMCKIRDAGKVKARDRIAVLASLNLAFELTQTQTQRPEPPLADTGPAAVGTTDWDDLLHRLDLALDSDGRLL